MRTAAAPTPIGGSQTVSLIKDEFRRGVTLEDIPYQKGIRATVAWPTRRQCLRIIPGYDETGVYHQLVEGRPYVMDFDPSDYLTDTFTMVNTIVGFGASRSNVISDYRPGSPEALRFAGNTVLNCVAETICRSVAAANKGRRPTVAPGPQWASWTTYNERTKTRPILCRPRNTLLFQALVWELNGDALRDGKGGLLKDGNGQPLPMVYVFGIDNAKTISNVFDALITPIDKSKPLDGVENNQFHGMAEQDGSLVFFLPGREPIQNSGKFSNFLRPHVSDDASDWTVRKFPLTDAQIKSWWHPWDRILNYLTPDEQCRLVAQEFGADTLNYIVANDPRLSDVHVPQDIAARGLGRYAEPGSAPAPAAAPSTGLMSGLGLGAQPAPAAPAPARGPSLAFPSSPAPQPTGPSQPTVMLNSRSPAMKQALQDILKHSATQEDASTTNLAKELDDWGDTDVFEPVG